MKKYAILREFFPWNLFAPPISEKFLAMSVPHMKPPKALWRDKDLDVTTHEIESYDGGKITCFVLSPKDLSAKAPCPARETSAASCAERPWPKISR